MKIPPILVEIGRRVALWPGLGKLARYLASCLALLCGVKKLPMDPIGLAALGRLTRNWPDQRVAASLGPKALDAMKERDIPLPVAASSVQRSERASRADNDGFAGNAPTAPSVVRLGPPALTPVSPPSCLPAPGDDAHER